MRRSVSDTVPRRVATTDGNSLAVYESGDPAAPTVLAVHGYPDNHAVWDGVVARLAERFHVVTYDVRGAGASDKPTRRSAYRMTQLGDDLAAVVEAVSPDRSVHLLAHDWGSIQAWPAIASARLEGRVATFTSVSGPSLDYAAVWLRQIRRHPRAALRQLAASYYTMLFQLPGLPEVFARSAVMDRALNRPGAGSNGGPPPPRTTADKVNGIWLYRANMLSRLGRSKPRPVSVPVQVIAPDGDTFVTVPLALESPRPWVVDLTTHTVPGGHWIVHEQPELIAQLTAAFISEHDRTGAHR